MGQREHGKEVPKWVIKLRIIKLVLLISVIAIDIYVASITSDPLVIIALPVLLYYGVWFSAWNWLWRLQPGSAIQDGDVARLRKLLETDPAAAKWRHWGWLPWWHEGVPLLGFAWAAYKGAPANKGDKYLEIVKLLIDFGADVDATLDGCTNLFAALATAEDPHHRCVASTPELYQYVTLLVDQGANVNAKDPKTGVTPLIAAVAANDLNIVKHLVSHGADVLLDCERWGSVLHTCAMHGNEDMLRFLIEAGAALNVKTKEGGESPLHVAAINGNLNTVRVLLEYGADINARNNGKGTPLHQAVWDGKRIDLVECLLQNGADPNAKTVDGFTPLEMAKNRGHDGIIRLLINKDAHQ